MKESVIYFVLPRKLSTLSFTLCLGSIHNYRHTPCCVCSAKLKENSNGTSTTQFLLTSNKEFAVHPQQLSITEARQHYTTQT